MLIAWKEEGQLISAKDEEELSSSTPEEILTEPEKNYFPVTRGKNT